MKTTFNGVVQLSQIVQMTAEQNTIDAKNAEFLNLAEQRFGDNFTAGLTNNGINNTL